MTDDNRALVPSSERERPTFTAEELALVDPGAADADDVLEAARNAVASGAFTVEEAKRHWNLSAEEVAEIAKPRARSRPATALQRIDAELARLDSLRRSDSRLYWTPEIQAREARLYADRELAAAGVPAELPQEVLDDWGRSPQGVSHHFGVARAAAVKAMEVLDENEQAELQHGFDGLPASARSTIYMFMGVEPSGTARPDEVKRFAEGSEDGAALVREWSDHAARNLGIARGRIEMMAKAAKSSADRDAGLAWLDGLPSNQFRAVLNALLP
jgi:hypothetical protein